MSGPAILFVCLHNACRSRIAEAAARRWAPGTWTIASAGTDPSLGVDRKAARVLRRHGLAMPSGRPKGFEQLPDVRWDFVVEIGCGELPSGVRAKSRGQWIIPDPNNGPSRVYERLYRELSGRVRRLVVRLEKGGA